MRKIVFRGKSLRTEKWIQGYLFRCWERAYIAWGMVNDNADMKEVDPETVCQYTGLTDKNSRKIFEGDILRIKTENLSKKDGCFVVEWSEPGSCFVACGKSYLAHFDNAYEDYREVIGNIFDNPELLKAGQQLETS